MAIRVKVKKKPRKKSREEIRNEFFIDCVYSDFRELFKIWGWKFCRSVGMTPDEAESEAIKIAIEQTDIRMDSIDEYTVANIIHATKQRMINLCNKNIAQKRNNYAYTVGYYCECGRELSNPGVCECGREVLELSNKRTKIYDACSEEMRDSGHYPDRNICEDNTVRHSYSSEYLKRSTEQEDNIYLNELINELKKEMNWRFKSSKVKDTINLIYELLVEHAYSEKEVCELLDLEDSTFYLYRSRIMECYFIVKNRVDGKFARKGCRESKIKDWGSCI